MTKRALREARRALRPNEPARDFTELEQFARPCLGGRSPVGAALDQEDEILAVLRRLGNDGKWATWANVMHVRNGQPPTLH